MADQDASWCSSFSRYPAATSHVNMTNINNRYTRTRFLHTRTVSFCCRLNWLTSSPLFDLALTSCVSGGGRIWSLSLDHRVKLLHRIKACIEPWLRLHLRPPRRVITCPVTKTLFRSLVWRKQKKAMQFNTAGPHLLLMRRLPWPTFHCAVTFDAEDLIGKKVNLLISKCLYNKILKIGPAPVWHLCHVLSGRIDSLSRKLSDAC